MADGVAPNDIDAALKASAQRVETGNFTGETARLGLDTGGAGEQVNPLCPHIAAPLVPPTK
jgi:hypothetical protein